MKNVSWNTEKTIDSFIEEMKYIEVVIITSLLKTS